MKKLFKEEQLNKCVYCDKYDTGFNPLNSTMEYTGLEISMSSTGIIRARHYPTLDYKDNFDSQDNAYINYCPMCGRALKNKSLKIIR